MTLTDLFPILFILGVLFASTFVRATFGFGDALVAMPILALAIDLRTAAPIVALVSTTIGIIIILKTWKEIQFRSAWRLIISSIAGIPCGVYMLKEVHDSIVKCVLALMIAGFSMYKLTTGNSATLITERASYFFGFLAGLFGGACSTPGPPVVIYGSLRKWNPASFRATLQGFFFVSGSVVLAGHLGTGLWTRDVIQTYLFALPVVLFAIYLGNKVHYKIPSAKFDSYLYVLLLLSGILLFMRNIGQMIITMTRA
ncbi:sulfite exporter TauE/SafE family protein [Candidatus Hydrogenedentota bacterium]